MALPLLANCGQPAENLIALEPRVTFSSAASGLEVRIQRVEDGLGVLGDDRQTLLDERSLGTI